MAAYKRWYDHDPKLLEVIELLKNYQDELKEHAVVFLDKLEQKVSKEALERFYDLVKPVNGCRWYDKDPIISKTVGLLRVRVVCRQVCQKHKKRKEFYTYRINNF